MPCATPPGPDRSMPLAPLTAARVARRARLGDRRVVRHRRRDRAGRCSRPARGSRCRRVPRTSSHALAGGPPGPRAGGAARLHAGRRGRRGVAAHPGAWGGCDLVLVVAGTHREVRAWELTRPAPTRCSRPTSTVRWRRSPRCCPVCIAQGRGAIGIVSSVAGYRGLPKALVYGASKAALINFTETLYLDLHARRASACTSSIPASSTRR